MSEWKRYRGNMSPTVAEMFRISYIHRYHVTSGTCVAEAHTFSEKKSFIAKAYTFIGSLTVKRRVTNRSSYTANRPDPVRSVIRLASHVCF